MITAEQLNTYFEIETKLNEIGIAIARHLGEKISLVSVNGRPDDLVTFSFEEEHCGCCPSEFCGSVSASVEDLACEDSATVLADRYRERAEETRKRKEQLEAEFKENFRLAAEELERQRYFELKAKFENHY
jgi:hypothetical protein